MTIAGRTWVEYIPSANNCLAYTVYVTWLGGWYWHKRQHPVPYCSSKAVIYSYMWNLVLCHLLNISHIATSSM